jgi:hypothetical protein
MKTIEEAVQNLEAELDARGDYALQIWLKRQYPISSGLPAPGVDLDKYVLQQLEASRVCPKIAEGHLARPITRTTIALDAKEIQLWVVPVAESEPAPPAGLTARMVHSWLQQQTPRCAGFLVEAVIGYAANDNGHFHLDLPLLGLGWNDAERTLGFLAGDRADWIPDDPNADSGRGRRQTLLQRWFGWLRPSRGN